MSFQQRRDYLALCAVLAISYVPTEAAGVTLEADTWGKPAHVIHSSWDVTGWVRFEQTVGSTVPGQKVTWSLQGIDKKCGTSYALTGNSMECGIHIYTSTDCSTYDASNEHYYTVASDPWLPVQYAVTYATTDTTEAESSTATTVLTGLSAEMLVGKTVMIHDAYNGGRQVACAAIKYKTTTTTTLSDDATTTVGTTTTTTTETTTTTNTTVTTTTNVTAGTMLANDALPSCISALTVLALSILAIMRIV